MNRREIIVKNTTRGPIVIDRPNTRVVFKATLRGIDGPAILLAATERKLDDIWIYNASIGNCTIGIQSIGACGVSGLRIDNARIWKCKNGIQLPSVWDGVISQSKVWDCDETGVDLIGSWNLHCNHVGVSTCGVGFKLCKWSSHRIVSQVNTSCDVMMHGLEDCHILAGSYFEDRPIANDEYYGTCLSALDCRDCSIDVPIVQRGHELLGLVNCDVTLRSQRGVGIETNNWRWRNKPSAIVKNCRGGRYRWPTNGTIAIENSNVEQYESHVERWSFGENKPIEINSTVFFKAKSTNGGRISFGGDYQMFPSSIMAWNSLYLPDGSSKVDVLGDVEIEKTFFCNGNVGLNHIFLD